MVKYIKTYRRIIQVGTLYPSEVDQAYQCSEFNLNGIMIDGTVT
jgi:hypothetical protein